MDLEQLASLEEDLRKDLEAISRVKQILALKNGSLSRPDDRQIRLPIRIQEPDDPLDADDVEEARSDSLVGTIERIINSDLNVRWTTAKMLTRLQSLKFPLKAKKPIYSVGQSMQKLEEKGKIRIVRRGTGSAPNIYRGKATEPNTEDHSQGGEIGVESTPTE